jgi:hypothetical protein
VKMITGRLPALTQITPVFAIIIFINFSWAIVLSFWVVPSWLNYVALWDILAGYAYILAFVFLESLLLLALILFLAFLLPFGFLRQKFVPQAGLLVLLFTIATLIFHWLTPLAYDWTASQITWVSLLIFVGVILLGLSLSYWITQRIPVLEKIITGFAERASVFLILYVPLSILSIIIIIFRNLF